MSWDTLGLVENLPANAMDSRMRFVLLCLAYHENNETRQCNPSMKRIHNFTALSTSTIHTALAKLEENGWLTIEHRSSAEYGQMSNLYHLDLRGAYAGAAGGPMREPHNPYATVANEQEENSKIEQKSREELEGNSSLPSRMVPPKLSPELIRVLETWQGFGLGHVSQNARTELRKLIAEHGEEWVVFGLLCVSEQGVRWPVSWLKTTIPGWKRAPPKGSPAAQRDGKATGDHDGGTSESPFAKYSRAGNPPEEGHVGEDQRTRTPS